MVYVLKILQENSTGALLKDIEEYLKTEFKSYDYMIGFYDGYLFDNYIITTLEEFEKSLNNSYYLRTYVDTYYIKFVKVMDSKEYPKD